MRDWEIETILCFGLSTLRCVRANAQVRSATSLLASLYSLCVVCANAQVECVSFAYPPPPRDSSV